MSEEAMTGPDNIKRDATLCVCVGKCVGNTYRCVGEKTEALGYYLGSAFHSVCKGTNVIGARLKNLFKTIKSDGHMAHWELKIKDDFSKLGAAIYHRKGAAPEEMFQDESIKAVLEKLNEDHARITEIQQNKNNQKKRMQELAVFRHATGRLRSPDAGVRRSALGVLAKLGDVDALPRVAELLEDPDQSVRNDAITVFQKLTQDRISISKEDQPS